MKFAARSLRRFSTFSRGFRLDILKQSFSTCFTAWDTGPAAQTYNGWVVRVTVASTE